MPLKKPMIQPYKDGVAGVYEVSNAAEPGNTPIERLTPKERLPYDQQMVGMYRYMQGMQSGMRIDQKIRMPRREGVRVDNVVILTDGLQYAVKQVQYPPEAEPPSMDISLERLGNPYDID